MNVKIGQFHSGAAHNSFPIHKRLLAEQEGNAPETCQPNDGVNDPAEPEPPKSQATRSNWKMPTSPQLTQPMMDKISARVSIFLPPFHIPDADRICAFSDFITKKLQNSNSSVIIKKDAQKGIFCNDDII